MCEPVCVRASVCVCVWGGGGEKTLGREALTEPTHLSSVVEADGSIISVLVGNKGEVGKGAGREGWPGREVRWKTLEDSCGVKGKGANARGDTRKGRSVQAITAGDGAVIAMTYGDLIPLFSGNLASGSDSDSRGHARVSAQVRIVDRIKISDRMIVDITL